MKRILLGQSWFSNHEPAVRTLGSFARPSSEHPSPPFLAGVETEADRSGALPDGTPVSQVLATMARLPGLDELWLWDRQSDLTAKKLWPSKLPSLFFERYSYGGAVARLLLLRAVANSPFLVRVDPGCLAPPDLRELIERHIILLEKGPCRVVSGRYTERIALRHQFVHPSRVEEFLDLAARFTGINPRRQITGGAACAFHELAPPPPVFDGVLIWASDDGFYQRYFPHLAHLDPNSLIPRDAPGFRMTLTEYLVRVASAAALEGLLEGDNLPAATQKSLGFFDALVQFVPPDQIDIAQGHEILQERAPRIETGLRHYQSLLKHWPEILERVQGMEELRRICKIA